MLHDNVFKIDFYALAVQLMPVQWRKPRHIAFVKVLVTPFVLMLQQLRKYRSTTIYKLQHDSRIGKVEKVLNDKFDIIERRILIIEGQRKRQNYSFYRSENREALATPFVTYSQDEVAEFSSDFEVCIPTVVGLISSDLTQLNTLVRYYADKDKHFVIKLI
ncbi:MAG: hypothetical protein V3V28_08590 [Polaribacter sp.]|uniref:hypothetical protein n=1 Tax=Polaribacter sp. TaxID=1920175 RepID=UPI002F35D161